MLDEQHTRASILACMWALLQFNDGVTCHTHMACCGDCMHACARRARCDVMHSIAWHAANCNMHACAHGTACWPVRHRTCSSTIPRASQRAPSKVTRSAIDNSTDSQAMKGAVLRHAMRARSSDPSFVSLPRQQTPPPNFPFLRQNPTTVGFVLWCQNDFFISAGFCGK